MTTTPAPPTPPRSRYSMGSLANMGRSLFVILVLVGGLIAIVPRVSEVRQPPVDAAAVVGYAVKSSGTPFSFPTPVPDGWVATNARYAASTDSVPTWQAGWTTPDNRYFSLAQAKDATTGWLTAATNKAEATGSAQIAGRTWKTYVDDRKQSIMSSAADGLTTVVATTGSMEDLAAFVGRLAPAPASG
ncbi:MAG TPA: DUF4245 domain-containing protein [Dermatophilaceae bacterium]|nr:DUF4245 domain-containing protein [Actinomycetales bacterium]HMT32001.1 DUF4245 domain-containing protein [Dermatophilaceae bacterium]HMT88305.1 DUF4245 domain-containing protein [Dermatophilaceae bacterium]